MTTTLPLPFGRAARFMLRGWQQHAFAATVLLLAARRLHGTFNAPFFFDDEALILTNPSLHSRWSARSPPSDTGTTVVGRPVPGLPARHRIAALYADVGRRADAIRQLEEILAADPQSPAAREAFERLGGGRRE